jgi:hypothetical protein
MLFISNKAEQNKKKSDKYCYPDLYCCKVHKECIDKVYSVDSPLVEVIVVDNAQG